MVLTLQAVHIAAAEIYCRDGMRCRAGVGVGVVGGTHIQFDGAERQILPNICRAPAAAAAAAILTQLRCNKLLARCSSVGKQDFRATTKINVSLKFMQCRATF